ncbi:MAG TPA: DUF3011 domain-containing protein, partial [Terriglobales bacterium]|nr:DUF3011 domain-containing protein [Terriglobales bacterium]
MYSKRWILFSLFMLFAVSVLHAQDNSLKCESNDGGRKYCGSYRYNQVQMDRQISGSPCIQNQTWGVDDRGLWVDRGCRAYFRIREYRRGEYGQGGYPSGPAGPGGWWEPEPNSTWPPRGEWHGGRWDRGGACFYKDRNFSGSFFCMRRGEQRESLGGYGDDISSIRVFGGARVIVFNDSYFRGANAGFRGDIADLRQAGVRHMGSHTWNNRISSV